MTVDVLLRASSLAVIVLTWWLIFRSKRGSPDHIIIGTSVVVFGAAIFVLTSIRGAREEISKTMYSIHLGLGWIFFSSIFTVAFFGVMALVARRKGWAIKKHISFAHGWAGRIALASVALTVVAGVASVFSK